MCSHSAARRARGCCCIIASADRQRREIGSGVVGGRVSDLIEFAHSGHKMGCIVADPSWPICGATLPYLAIDIGDLKNLLISDLGG
jgi:hypothetical protein